MDDKWDALLIAVISKFEPLVVLARQSDDAVVDLLTVYFVQLQFFARTEVIEAPVNNREIILHYFFFTVFFYWLFLLYFPVAEKLFVLFPSNFLVICELTRRDRFLIHKWPRLSLYESCRYKRLTCFSFLLSVSRKGRACLFSMPYTFDIMFNCSNLEMSLNVIGNSISVRFNTVI